MCLFMMTSVGVVSVVWTVTAKVTGFLHGASQRRSGEALKRFSEPGETRQAKVIHVFNKHVLNPTMYQTLITEALDTESYTK